LAASEASCQNGPDCRAQIGLEEEINGGIYTETELLMNRLIIYMLIAGLFMLSACGDEKSTDPPPFEGELYQVGSVVIAVVGGTNIEMGEQLGKLLRGRIRELYRLKVENYLNEIGKLSYGDLLTRSNELWDTVVPGRIKAICSGMAATSGLKLDQIKVMQLIDVILLDAEGCSGVILWDDYSDGRILLLGHNTDSENAAPYAHLLSITVLKPEGEENQIAIFGYPGILSVTAGVNNHGLVIVQNEAPMADVFTEHDLSYMWRSLLSHEWLRDYDTINELREIYTGRAVAIGCNYLIADRFFGTCFETSTDLIAERQMDANGLICETNHFTSSMLQAHNSAYFGNSTNFSTYRRVQFLLSKANELKGSLTMTSLMESVLSVPESNGGVFNNTVRSFVFRPMDQQLVLMSPVSSELLYISLKDYFD